MKSTRRKGSISKRKRRNNSTDFSKTRSRNITTSGVIHISDEDEPNYAQIIKVQRYLDRNNKNLSKNDSLGKKDLEIIRSKTF